MPIPDRNPDAERPRLRGLVVRLLVQWAVFCVVMVVLAGALDFLYGEPRKPSFDIVVESLDRHGAVFAAVLVLIPIMLRDTVRYVQGVLRGRQQT
ncbi:MAG: hypothetical protein ACE5KM_17620 [Planctomycetaceae bacterium]